MVSTTQFTAVIPLPDPDHVSLAGRSLVSAAGDIWNAEVGSVHRQGLPRVDAVVVAVAASPATGCPVLLVTGWRDHDLLAASAPRVGDVVREIVAELHPEFAPGLLLWRQAVRSVVGLVAYRLGQKKATLTFNVVGFEYVTTAV